MAMGIKKGDKVAVWATNEPEWIVTMFASAKIGAILVTVNTNYKIFELEYLLQQSDSMTLILMEEFKGNNYVNTLYELCPELKTSKPGEFSCDKLPFLKNVIFIGEGRHEGMYHWDDLFELAKTVDRCV